MRLMSAGGAANAYFPPPEDEGKVREQQEKLRQARDASRDRVKETERGERVNQATKD